MSQGDWGHGQGAGHPAAAGHGHQTRAEAWIHDHRVVRGLADCSGAVVGHDGQEQALLASQAKERKS